MVEYDIQNILKTGAIILLVFIPLLIVLCCAVAVVVRRLRGEKSSASWHYLNSLERPGRRSSISKAESTPLKSAATLADADSGLGLSKPSRRKDANTLQQAAPSEGVGEEPDNALDGVYYTHEPLPGKPNVDFEDKVWDFEDEDVFKSKSNSSLSSPFSGKGKESPPQVSINSDHYRSKQYGAHVKPTNSPTVSPVPEPSPPELPKTLPPDPAGIPKTHFLFNDSINTLPLNPPQPPQKLLPAPLIPTPRNSASSTDSSKNASRSGNGPGSGSKLHKSSISTAI